MAGIVFKIMHWPGSSILIILSASLLSIYMIPVAIGNILSYKNKTFIGICNGIGAFGGMILAVGLLFKIMHWPGAGAMLFISTLFALTAFILFAILFMASKERIHLSPGTFFSTICFGLLIYGISIGGTTLSSLKNVTSSAIKIEENYNQLIKINEAISTKSTPEEIKQVVESTANLNKYLNTLKSILYEQADAIPKEVADTISLQHIASKDNYDVPTRILGLSNPDAPQGGQFTALELKSELAEFNHITSSFGMNISMKNTSNIHGYHENWESRLFYHYTLAQVILTLNQIQLEANIICNSILTNNLLESHSVSLNDSIN